MASGARSPEAAQTAQIEVAVLAELDPRVLPDPRTAQDIRERAHQRAQVARAVADMRAALEPRLLASIGAQITAGLSLAPVLAVRLPAGLPPKVALDELARQPGILAVDVRSLLLRQPHASPGHTDLPPAPAASSEFPSDGPTTALPPLVGIVELGRPDLTHPQLEASARPWSESGRRRLRSLGDPVVHPHATAVVAALLASTSDDAFDVLCYSLPRDRRQLAWLSALDELIARGASVINLSFGVWPDDLEDGWGLLERGIEVLCALHGVTVVASAGNGSRDRAELHQVRVPARDPAVLAVGGVIEEGSGLSAFERGCASKDGKPELAAVANHPFGETAGTSMAAPRVTKIVAEAMGQVRQAAHRPELARALVLAACEAGPRDPHGSDGPVGHSTGLGIPARARLQEICRRGWFAWGTGNGLVPLPPDRSESGGELRAVLCWQPRGLDELLGQQQPRPAVSLALHLVDATGHLVAQARAYAAWAPLVTRRPAAGSLRVQSAGIPWGLAWWYER